MFGIYDRITFYAFSENRILPFFLPPPIPIQKQSSSEDYRHLVRLKMSFDASGCLHSAQWRVILHVICSRQSKICLNPKITWQWFEPILIRCDSKHTKRNMCSLFSVLALYYIELVIYLNWWIVHRLDFLISLRWKRICSTEKTRKFPKLSTILTLWLMLNK